MQRSIFRKPNKIFELSLSSPNRNITIFCLFAFALLALAFPKYSQGAEEYAHFLKQARSNEVSKKIRIKPLMETSALGHAAITSVLSQKMGQLWVAEQSGLYMYDGRSLLSFTTINPSQKYYAPSLDISSITQDHQGNVWASSRSTGIIRYNRVTQIFENVDQLPYSSVAQVVFMMHDALIYIHEGNIKGFRVSSRLPINEIQEHNRITGKVSKLMVQDKSNIIIFADLGIFRLNIDDSSIEYITPILLETNDESLLTQPRRPDNGARTYLHTGSVVRAPRSGSDRIPAQVIKVTATHKGLFFAGTDEGLFVFGLDGSFVGMYNTRNSGLTNDHITHLHSSGDVLWIGTYEGLSFLEISDFEIYNYLSDSISNEILNFSQDESGDIWLGSYHGLFRFDPDSLFHEPFSKIFPDMTLNDKRIMALDINGTELFIGTRRSGLLILDTVSRETVFHNIKDNPNLQVTNILGLSEDNLLVSSFDSGMYVLDSVQRNSSSEYAAEKLTNDRITILRKQGSKVIAANETEVYLYTIESQDLSAINIVYPLGNVQPTITAIHPLSDDSILIGTQSHGVFSVNLSSEEQAVFSAESILPEIHAYAAAVYAIEEDQQNRIWLSTSNGLFLYSGHFEFLRRYNAGDGIQGNKFNFGSSFIDRDGFLYFGGSRGYNRFLPSQISTSSNPPSTFITSLNISGSEWPARFTGQQIDSITLNHKDRFITLEFSALDYTDPESTRYRHKLVGFDTDWVDIGNRGSATYTNLPAGEYVFRVQAVNSAGIWNYDGLAIDLKVEPAPWLTWWAFTLYFLAFLGLAALSLQFYRSYMLKKQQLKQADEMQLIADRIADELQDQIDFQSKLTDSIHSYNKELLYWARFCTDATVEYETSDKQHIHDRILFRLGVLETIQDSLYYQGERLYARLHNCATALADQLGQKHPQLRDRLTIVNDIQRELIPATQAVPLAIILAELLENSLAHAFADKRDTCFVRFSLALTPNPGASNDTARFVYQDDGVGIPQGLKFDSPESSGFAIIGHAADTLGCELTIGEQDHCMVTGSFDLPWNNLRPG